MTENLTTQIVRSRLPEFRVTPHRIYTRYWYWPFWTLAATFSCESTEINVHDPSVNELLWSRFPGVALREVEFGTIYTKCDCK